MILKVIAFHFLLIPALYGGDRLKWVEPVDHLVPSSTPWSWEDFPHYAKIGSRVHGGLGPAWGWYVTQRDRSKDEFAFELWNEESPEGFCSVPISSETKEKIYELILRETLIARYPAADTDKSNTITISLDQPWTQFMVKADGLGFLTGEIIHGATPSDRISKLGGILYEAYELHEEENLSEKVLLKIIESANQSVDTTAVSAPR